MKNGKNLIVQEDVAKQKYVPQDHIDAKNRIEDNDKKIDEYFQNLGAKYVNTNNRSY
jgi:uncharacterized protein YlzI (FlbEa/FlbD family)